jgi:hypothetical protein
VLLVDNISSIFVLLAEFQHPTCCIGKFRCGIPIYRTVAVVKDNVDVTSQADASDLPLGIQMVIKSAFLKLFAIRFL